MMKMMMMAIGISATMVTKQTAQRKPKEAGKNARGTTSHERQAYRAECRRAQTCEASLKRDGTNHQKRGGAGWNAMSYERSEQEKQPANGEIKNPPDKGEDKRHQQEKREPESRGEGKGCPKGEDSERRKRCHQGRNGHTSDRISADQNGPQCTMH